LTERNVQCSVNFHEHHDQRKLEPARRDHAGRAGHERVGEIVARYGLDLDFEPMPALIAHGLDG
jgi:hypothetical protein